MFAKHLPAIAPQTHFRLPMIRFCSARIIAVLPALLLLALLAAQWTGVQHRVAHAWIPATADHAAAADDDDLSHLAHSCLLLDAAALGVTLQTAVFLPVCLRATTADAQPPGLPSWFPHLFRHFSPRAPPLG